MGHLGQSFFLFFFMFLKGLLCLWLHLFDHKYKNTKTVGNSYFYFFLFEYFKMQFIILTAKLNFQQFFCVRIIIISLFKKVRW